MTAGGGLPVNESADTIDDDDLLFELGLGDESDGDIH
jgi:hypothetical protein